MGACDMLRDICVIFTCLFLSLCLVSADADRASPSSKNPCQEQTATKDEGFVIGLAYWPGGTVADWGNSSKGLNPCSADAGDLGDISVASFELKVDTIGLLQTDAETESGLFERANPDVLSVVAFTKDIRSEARYIWANDVEVTGGTGTGVLRNLVLIADFDDGELKFLRWQDPGCLGCSDNRCVQTGIVYDEKPTFSCTPASTEDCTSGANNVDNFECFTSYQVGMSGTDDDSSVLNTGVQLQRIQSLSLTSLYSDASNAVTDLFDSGSG